MVFRTHLHFKYPEEDPLEIILQVDTGYGIDEILDVGLVTLNPKLKRYLQEYCATRRITLKDFMRELLTEWYMSKKIEIVFEKIKKVSLIEY